MDLFEGNKAETKTLIPVLTRFRDRHQAHDIVVVADAGMLSAANLLALEDNGFRFIVGSRTGKIPYELEAHVERHGNYLAEGATIETTRRMGTGEKARDRRVACHYAFKRAQHDNKAINAMVERAEKVASGERPLKKDRFVTFTDTSTSVNWDLVERARSLAGIKGYVTNIDPALMNGPAVVAAYHDLYQVERLAAGKCWQDHDLVFASQAGTPLDASHVRRAFKAITKKAGLGENWTPRELRHSFVSIMSDNGVPIETIADLVGHASTAVTEEVYRHQLKPVITRGAETMNTIFKQDQAKSA